MASFDQRPSYRTLVRALGGDVVNLHRLPQLHHLGRHALSLPNRCHSTERLEQDRVSLVGIMAHAEAQLFAHGVVLPDRAARRPGELVRPRDDRVQYNFKVQR